MENLKLSTSLFEREALGELETLQRYAYHLCRDREKSKDLVQETVLRALRGFDGYQEGTNCRAWLMRIMKNTFVNNYRRKVLEARFIESSEDPERPEPNADVTYRKDIDRTFTDEVALSLNDLPLEYQTAVILGDVEGMPYHEIADFLQIPLGTVRSRLHRGRKILADKLRPYAERRGYGNTADRS